MNCVKLTDGSVLNLDHVVTVSPPAPCWSRSGFCLRISGGLEMTIEGDTEAVVKDHQTIQEAMLGQRGAAE